MTDLLASKPKKKFKVSKPFLYLLPSFILVSIFVYGFITYTVAVSFSGNWKPAKPDFTPNDQLFKVYEDLFANARFQADIRNTMVFTILFLAVAIIAGFFIAVMVNNMLRSKAFFRSLFLLPYALSFVVTGVVWRWIFNPDSGVNLFFQYTGVAQAYEQLTGQPLRPEWLTSPEVVADISPLLQNIIPGGDFIQTQLGIPLALVPVVIAASWQLCGFAMAMFLAGLVGIPEEIHEAAMMDGISGPRYIRSIAIPMLKPITITTVVILLSVSFKMFDLVFVMSGTGVGFATDMPGIFVYDSMYKALAYNQGAAASVIMLFLVLVVIVPYLISSNKQTQKED